MGIGQLIETLYCTGWPEGRKLTEKERQDMVEFALPFEECSFERTDLEAMNDRDLVQSTYWIMAEYAKGQV